MNIYRFSPITTEADYIHGLEYLVKAGSDMADAFGVDPASLTTLKLFAHYPEEYERMLQWTKLRGAESSYTSDTSYYVDLKPALTIGNRLITLLGVRRPDPYRMQVGCVDYEVDDLAFYAAHESHDNLNYRPIHGQDGSIWMCELWHPDFDILGYVVQKETT